MFHIHPVCMYTQHSCDYALIVHQARLHYLNGVIDVRIRLGCLPPVILQRLAGNKSIVFRTLDSKLPVRFDHSPCEERRTAGGPSEETSHPFFLAVSSEPGTELRWTHFPSVLRIRPWLPGLMRDR